MQRGTIVGAMLALTAASGRSQGLRPEWTKPGDTVKVWADAPYLRASRRRVLGVVGGITGNRPVAGWRRVYVRPR